MPARERGSQVPRPSAGPSDPAHLGRRLGTKDAPSLCLDICSRLARPVPAPDTLSLQPLDNHGASQKGWDDGQGDLGGQHRCPSARALPPTKQALRSHCFHHALSLLQDFHPPALRQLTQVADPPKLSPSAAEPSSQAPVFLLSTARLPRDLRVASIRVQQGLPGPSGS